MDGLACQSRGREHRLVGDGLLRAFLLVLFRRILRVFGHGARRRHHSAAATGRSHSMTFRRRRGLMAVRRLRSRSLRRRRGWRGKMLVT